jgi:hypothetical protein
MHPETALVCVGVVKRDTPPTGYLAGFRENPTISIDGYHILLMYNSDRFSPLSDMGNISDRRVCLGGNQLSCSQLAPIGLIAQYIRLGLDSRLH